MVVVLSVLGGVGGGFGVSLKGSGARPHTRMPESGSAAKVTAVVLGSGGTNVTVGTVVAVLAVDGFGFGREVRLGRCADRTEVVVVDVSTAAAAAASAVPRAGVGVVVVEVAAASSADRRPAAASIVCSRRAASLVSERLSRSRRATRLVSRTDEYVDAVATTTATAAATPMAVVVRPLPRRWWRMCG